jgi:hypothetical protein
VCPFDEQVVTALLDCLKPDTLRIETTIIGASAGLRRGFSSDRRTLYGYQPELSANRDTALIKDYFFRHEFPTPYNHGQVIAAKHPRVNQPGR